MDLPKSKSCCGAHTHRAAEHEALSPRGVQDSEAWPGTCGVELRRNPGQGPPTLRCRMHHHPWPKHRRTLGLKCTSSGSGAPMAAAHALAMPSKVT